MSALGIDFYLVDGQRRLVGLAPGQRYLFGRHPNADFSLTDTLASREHCELVWNDDGLGVVRDLNSRNGTYVNGQLVQGFRPLNDRDTIQIGGLHFTFAMLPAGSDTRPLTEGDGASDVNRLETFELSEGGNSHNASFGGELRGGLAGMLRFFTVTDKSGRLVLDGDPYQCLWFERGTPRAARCGMRCGLKALEALVAHPSGTFEFFDSEAIPEGEERIAGEETNILRAVLPGTALFELGIDAADLAKAEDLQRHLLSRVPDVPGWEIGLVYRGLAGISGDFYDVGFLADGRLLIVIGDVSGHGLQAALVVTNTLKTLRLLRRSHADLLTLLTQLNDEIRTDVLSGQFLTLCAMLLDPHSGSLEMVLAGHHAAWLCDKHGSVQTIGQRGLGMGLADGQLFRGALHTSTHTIERGACLVQCTDGVLEAMNAQRQQFGAEAVLRSISTTAPGSAQHTAQALADAVQSFAVKLEDDLTVLAIRRLPNWQPSARLLVGEPRQPGSKPISGTKSYQRREKTEFPQSPSGGVPSTQTLPAAVPAPVRTPITTPRHAQDSTSDPGPLSPRPSSGIVPGFDPTLREELTRLRKLVNLLMVVILVLLLVVVGLALSLALRS